MFVNILLMLIHQDLSGVFHPHMSFVVIIGIMFYRISSLLFIKNILGFHKKF